MYEKLFNKGDKVEVIRNVDGHFNSSYFSGTVLRSPAKTKTHVYIEYNTLLPDELGSKPVREHVDASQVRPDPPREVGRSFHLCESVDAFRENGWRKGTIVGVFRYSKYLVLFDGSDEQIEVEGSDLRIHREWLDGFWVPPLEEHEKSSQLDVRPRELKFRIKYSGRTSEAIFTKGTVVEVKSDEEGYQNSWYTAVIVGFIENEKFLVEYQTLKTNDETELLKEEADVSCIRPCPPEIQWVDRFEQLEQVDAWYNDGWWVGHISKILDGLKYVVYFSATKEEMVFEHSKLRPHQEWIDGKWVAASTRSSPELKPKQLKLKIKYNRCTSEPKFSKGTTVEVKSDEEGYQGSWYTAVVNGSIGNDKFLVEYLTLKTDDESESLKEKADGAYIRPCPPKIQRVDRFKMLEEVDAWYNDGWWMGLICKVLDGLKYAVYFWPTNEELEFEHFKLRPHQEWIDGKWVVSFMKMPKLPVKSRLGKLKRQYCARTSVANFSNGTKVEVRSDEEGYQGSWYPALIVCPVKNGKYLIQYQTLKTDNEIELLKEEADAQSIRPPPPVIQRVDPFKPLEEVDAWYNDGWWVGQVCKVLGGSKYTVYFRTTNEVLEFQHSNLRPHQDWINGKWIGATRV